MDVESCGESEGTFAKFMIWSNDGLGIMLIGTRACSPPEAYGRRENVDTLHYMRTSEVDDSNSREVQCSKLVLRRQREFDSGNQRQSKTFCQSVYHAIGRTPEERLVIHEIMVPHAAGLLAVACTL